MPPDESTEELSDFELTQRLRAARGQPPLPDPESIEAKLRAGAEAMIEEHRGIRGIDYSRIVIDDPIPIAIPAPFVGTPPIPYKWPVKYKHGTMKIGDGPIVSIGSTSDNAIALAAGPMTSGTVTGRLKAWTGKK